MSRNNLPTFTNSNLHKLLEESLSPFSYVQEQDILEESGENGPIHIPRTTGTTTSVNDNDTFNSTLHTDTRNHTSWREESWEDRTMTGEHHSSSMINSTTFCDNDSNHHHSSVTPSFTSQTHFPQQNKRKKKSLKATSIEHTQLSIQTSS